MLCTVDVNLITAIASVILQRNVAMLNISTKCVYIGTGNILSSVR